MCSGFEWLMVGATVVNTMQQMDRADQVEQEGAERQQQAEFTAKQQDFQAQQSMADAQAEREAGEVRASKIRKAGKSTKSEAVAALAASGVEVAAGTPVKIQSEIVRNAEEDALNQILYGTRKGARLQQDAGVFAETAGQTRLTGERAVAGASRGADSARLGAFGSVLSGGAKLVGPGWKKAAKPMDWGMTGDFPDSGTVTIA